MWARLNGKAQVKLVAITGGIASGKSSVLHGLAARLGAPWISCDDIVTRLYEQEPVLAAVQERFGEPIVTQGRLDRLALGRAVFGDAGARRWLEGFLHPLVLQSVEAWCVELAGQTLVSWGVVEVPLLYEVDFPLKRDIDMVVGCSLSTQLKRIQSRDQLDEEQALRRIGAQLPMEHKVIRADVVVWNDGSKTVLQQLIGLAADRIQGIRS